MVEENLRNVLNSLSHLADHGEIPVHAFGTLLRAAKTDVISEHLHQKWLSDVNFSRIAAQIVYHFHRLDNHDISSLTSGCLANVLRDYKCRNDIRYKNRQMFRNYTRTLAEFYIVYKHIDLCLAQTLVGPLFNCLNELFDDNSDDEDIKCASQIIISYGNLLNEQSITDTTQLVMKSRNILCSNNFVKSEETNNLLLGINDLWSVKWNKSKLPDILQLYHEDRCTFIDYFSQYRHKNSNNTHRSRSSSGYDSPITVQPNSNMGSKKTINHMDPIEGSHTPIPLDDEQETTV